MLKRQIWKEFEKAVNGKRLFLFGVGDGAAYFYKEHGKNFRISGILDNDQNKWGLSVENFLSVQKGSDVGGLIVSSVENLLSDGIKDVIILITSLNFYEEIAEQLENMGVHNYFALYPMIKDKGSSLELGEIAEYEKTAIEPKKLVFYTMGGYSGHGKAIAEQLLKIRQDLDIVWMVDDLTINVPKGIRVVYRKNKSAFLFEMVTAKLWVYDDQVPIYLEKRTGQVYIQVKHWSSITLKTFGLSVAKFRQNETAMSSWRHDSGLIDYIFTGSDFDTRTCRKGFDYWGEIIQLGSPRTDILFNNTNIKERIYELYGINQSNGTLLYAPTFRVSDGKDCISKDGNIELDFEYLKEALEKKFGGEWNILLRLHPRVAKNIRQLETLPYVIDVSHYCDGEELVAASDVLVTDYSSIMFEAAFVKKPVFLFATDKEEYINVDRELLIDYDTLPFDIAENNEELVQKIEKFDQVIYEKKVDKFMEQYGVHEDGYASERAADFILSLL